MQGNSPIDRSVLFWTGSGWNGVDLFFVLSGFLITGVLLDAKGSTGYFRNFYARRVLRIFPLYYGVVLVHLVVLRYVLNDPNHFDDRDIDLIWYLLHLSNLIVGLRSGRDTGLDHAWSLAIEEQFYLLWPLLVLWLNRRRLIMLCVVLIGLAIALRIGFVFGGAPRIGRLLSDRHPFRHAGSWSVVGVGRTR